MNTFQLWYALTANPVTSDGFSGVYSIDTLPLLGPTPELVICNTDPSDNPGKHWVLFYRDGDTLEFFDSLGKQLDKYGPEFVAFADNAKVRRVMTCLERIQPPGTSLCGEYCLYYAYARMKEQQMKDIIRFMPLPQTLCSFVRDIYCILINSNNNNYQLNNQICCTY